MALCELAGFEATYKKAAISITEIKWLQKCRYEAMANKELNDESREFLYALTFDHRGLPLHKGQVAGVDGCYSLAQKLR